MDRIRLNEVVLDISDVIGGRSGPAETEPLRPLGGRGVAPYPVHGTTDLGAFRLVGSTSSPRFASFDLGDSQ